MKFEVKDETEKVRVVSLKKDSRDNIDILVDGRVVGWFGQSSEKLNVDMDALKREGIGFAETE